MYLETSIKPMLESTPIAYSLHKAIYSKKGSIESYKTLEYNPAFLNIIGIKENEVNKVSEKITNEFIFKIIKEIPGAKEEVLNTILKNQSSILLGYTNTYSKWLKLNIIPGEKDHFIMQIVDITKEKLLENALKKQSKELSLILNSINDLIVVVDFSSTIININNTWKRLLGYESSEIIGKSINEFLSKKAYKRILDKFKDESLFESDYVFQTNLLKKDGSLLKVEWKSAIYENNIYSVGRDITALVETQEKIRYLSYHDKLTGLYNRAFFEEELKRLDNDRNLPLSIIMGDVNGLKIINDIFGHLDGDKLLKNIGDILKNSIRKGDILSRWGGDEFIILLPNTSEDVAEQIISRIRKKCINSKSQLKYGDISLGYATKHSSQVDIKDILADAENNMYKNKSLEGKEARNNILASLLEDLYNETSESKSNIQSMKILFEKIGKELNLSKEDINRLFLLAEFHNIGLISVPKELLNKSKDFTNEEQEIFKGHTETGYRIAKAIPELSHVANNILYHHEKWDGSGYPKGLKGKDIPYLNRIFSIVNGYNKLLQDKAYEDSLDSKKVIACLEKFKGSSFDPKLLDIFLNILKKKDLKI